MLEQDAEITRKELDLDHTTTDQAIESSWDEVGANEHRVMSYLHHVQHPNIMPLFASYTYLGTHNLLMPIATGGSLEDFLRSEQRPSGFVLDKQFYRALAGLASAISTLHNYRSAALNLQMIGYHHDLKPKNILVSGNLFVLADFGISKLKLGEDSRTMFRNGQGYYLAPECENVQRGFEKGVITRASDIWSFGCIMLEVLVFMTGGAKALKGFRDSRAFRDGSWETRTFFRGKSVNEAVTTKMRDLADHRNVTLRKATALLSSILLIRPTDRLKADAFAAMLRLLSVESAYSRATDTLEKHVRDHQSFDIIIEKERFRAWAQHLTLGEDTETMTAEGDILHIWNSDSQHELLLKTLDGLEERLLRNRGATEAGPPLVYLLREFNDILCSAFDDSVNARIHQRLETCLLSAEDGRSLEDLATDAQHSILNTDLGYKAAMKRMYKMSQESMASRDGALIIQRSALRDWEPFQACKRAEYFQGLDKPTIPVLIEWIVYGPHWAGNAGDTLFKRIGALVGFLNRVQDSPIDFKSRIFPCVGFFHEASKHAFGLVYDLRLYDGDSGNEEMSADLISLHGLIDELKDLNQRPSLEEIFTFAFQLAAVLLEFHKLSWLHKNLSSYNIIILRRKAIRTNQAILDSFKVIGFNHSRPSHPDEYTEGLWSREDDNKKYQHPDYLHRPQRYHARFDYYSLGLVLLELGMWKTLSKMNIPDDNSRLGSKDNKAGAKHGEAKSTQRLLRHVVPSLAHRMGKRYRDAVAKCLDGSLWSHTGSAREPTDTEAKVLLSFQSMIVEELRKCASF